MRRQTLVMAQATYTPVYFWLSIPIREFTAWIRELNELEKERELKRQQLRDRR